MTNENDCYLSLTPFLNCESVTDWIRKSGSEVVTDGSPQGENQVLLEISLETHALRCLVHLAVAQIHQRGGECVGEGFVFIHEVTGTRLPGFVHGQIDSPVIVRYRGAVVGQAKGPALGTIEMTKGDTRAPGIFPVPIQH